MELTYAAIIFWAIAIGLGTGTAAWYFLSLRDERKQANQQAQTVEPIAVQKPSQVIYKSGDRRARRPFEVTNCIIR